VRGLWLNDCGEHRHGHVYFPIFLLEMLPRGSSLPSIRNGAEYRHGHLALGSPGVPITPARMRHLLHMGRVQSNPSTNTCPHFRMAPPPHRASCWGPSLCACLSSCTRSIRSHSRKSAARGCVPPRIHPHPPPAATLRRGPYNSCACVVSDAHCYSADYG
jgi:hypothetical protein